MFESVSVSLRRVTAPLWNASQCVPASVLKAATRFAQSDSVPDTFSWHLISKMPTVTLKPGETYTLELPVGPMGAEYRTRRDSFSMSSGEYDMVLSTTLQVLVGEVGESSESISPLLLNVWGTAQYFGRFKRACRFRRDWAEATRSRFRQ